MLQTLRIKTGTAAMLITAALVLPLTAEAQESVFIRYKPTAAPAPTSAPFSLEAEITPEGLRGSLHIIGDITLKRGVMGSAAGGGASSAYFVKVDSETTTQTDSSGEFELEFTSQAGAAGSSEHAFLADLRINPDRASAAGPDEVAFEVFDRAIAMSSEVLELRFAATSASETLVGEPAQFFNTPRPGQDLIFTPPPIAAGSRFEKTLIIRGQSGVEAQVRIKVKHGI